MAPVTKRAFLPVALVVVLSAVLILLAVLQYRWSLEISRAEKTRIETALNTSMNQFRLEFYRELTQVSTAFRGDPTAAPQDVWTAYADRYQEWARSAARPDLVANVYVWQAAGGKLQQLTDGQFTSADWPAELVEMRAGMEHMTESPGPNPDVPPELRAFAWTFEERVPAIVRPVFNFMGGPRRLSGEPPRPGEPPARTLLGFLIVELNRGTIEKMLGEMAQRYFSGPEGFIYNVLVVNGAADRKVIYRSDPQLTAASLDPPDARANLTPVTPAETRNLEGAPPRPPNDPRRRGRARNFGMRTPSGGLSPARMRGSMILPSAAEAPWQLVARHKGGSLEEVVAAERRRNLVLSFGVLLLLAVSMALIVISAQRAGRLARLQMEFVAGVSHELRTPVAVICSAADNLAEGFVAPKEQVKEYGALIRNEGRRLAGMIEQILRFAAGQSRPAHYDLSPVAIGEIVAGVVANLSSLPEAEGFSIEQVIEPDLPAVEADAGALTHCLENLILNAFKYGGAARWARISAEAVNGGRRVRIAVEDRGGGIAPADLAHIFEPFYRGKAARAAQIHGSGLGLSLAREIAEGMGGKLEARSELGKGSTFTLELTAAARTEESLPRLA